MSPSPRIEKGPDPTPLTAVAQDYLKVIWTACEYSPEPVTTKMLSERMGVSPSTVSEAVRKLADQGLLDHARYGSIALTEAGSTAAVAMVRRHRLLETFLVEELGYGWDEVHDEAEVLEHAVSDLLIERIDRKLGRPDRDPHGDPIPSVEGALPDAVATVLARYAPGSTGRVARISDSDPDMLRHFADVGITLDSTITVIERREDCLRVALADGRTLDIGSDAADAIRMTP